MPISGNRPDPQIRRGTVAKLEAAVAERRARGQGQIFFLAGEAGSGRSATLRALAERLERSTPAPHLIAASFAEGVYTPLQPGRVEIGTALDVLGNLLALPATLLAGPFWSLIAQLLQLGAVSLDAVGQMAPRAAAPTVNPALLLKAALRQAASTGPVVCLLDQIDRGEAHFLADFLLLSAGELVRDRALTIVATLDGPASIHDQAEKHDSPLFPPARLVARKLATWLYLPPLSRAEVGAWLGDAEPELVAHLHAITGGNPTWLALLWDELWRAEKVQPHPESYRWQTAPGYATAALGTIHDILGLRLRKLLGEDDGALDAAQGLLATAALEGPVFTALALALALGEEADDVIDFCDERLVQSEEQPYGILEEAEPVAVAVGEGVRTLWRYAFVSPLFWYTLDRFALSREERAERAGGVAPALEGVYGIEAGRVAHVVARLYREAGQARKAQQWQWVAHTHQQAAAIYAHAALLMSMDDQGWDWVERGWAARKLNEAAAALYNNYPHETVGRLAAAAYELAVQAGLTGAQARALNLRGMTSHGLGEKEKALGYYEQALPLQRAVGDRAGEAATLNNIGMVFSDLGEQEKALGYFEQAVPLQRAVGDRTREATTLTNIGAVYSALGEQEKALGYFEQALPLRRAMGDRAGEATTLHNIGAVYSALGEQEKALGYFEQALPLRRAVGDRAGEATTLTNIGAVFSALGEQEKALGYYEQVLPLQRAVGDRAGEANTLNNIGLVFSDLGEKEKALGYYEQALPLQRAVGDRAGEANTLTNIGAVYSALGEKEKALGYLEQALPLQRAVGDRAGEATTLNNIGLVFSALGEQEKALGYFEQALPLQRAVGDRAGEANTLWNVAAVYMAQGRREEARQLAGQALVLFIAVRSPHTEEVRRWLAEMDE